MLFLELGFPQSVVLIFAVLASAQNSIADSDL